MKILFTGASSFTGYWIVNQLKKDGFDVIIVLNKFESNPSDEVRKKRLIDLKGNFEVYLNIDYGSKDFFELIKDIEFNIFSHHFFYTKDYKSQNYNISEALLISVGNVSQLFDIIRKKECNSIILTGTYFEEGEGGKKSNFPVSPYGLAKTLAYKIFNYYSKINNINLSKFVIPNPFGPYEDYKFTSYLADNWLNNKVPLIKTPSYIRDNIPVDLLAISYSYLVKENLKGNYIFKIAPSGYISSNKKFAEKVAIELSRRLKINCKFKTEKQKDFSEPLKRFNTDNMFKIIKNYKEDLFWDNLSKYYFSVFNRRNSV